MDEVKISDTGRSATPADDRKETSGLKSPRTRQPEITLHQLRVFWTIAHSASLTMAAKQLGLAQPSLSQQLSKLESIAGSRLFERRPDEMKLTQAGIYLLPRAESVLRSMRELEDGLAEFSGGERGVIRVSGITSVLRIILPGAITQMNQRFPGIDFDIHDNAPTEILELLYARRINIGLLAANSVAEAGVGFLQVPILDDPYVLAVPDGVRLENVLDPRRDLPREQREVLGRSIQFNFGTQHTKRVTDWCDRVLPDHHVVANCRNFEVAIEMVRAGLGVCLAPALSAVSGERALEGVRLYAVEEPPRRIVALIPPQNRRVEPYNILLSILQEVGAGFRMPPMLPTPPFLRGVPPSGTR